MDDQEIQGRSPQSLSCWTAGVRIVLLLAGTLLAGLPPALAHAEPATREQATLGYRILYGFAKSAASFPPSSPIQVTAVVRSRTPDVSLDGIHLTIKSKKGDLSIPVDSQGAYDLPLTDDLLSENPLVVTNQAKGTLMVDWKLRVNFGPGAEVSYQDLVAGVGPFNSALDAIGKSEPFFAGMRVAGLTFSTGGSDAGSFTIHSKNGPKQLPVANGRPCDLRFARALYEENPRVTTPSAKLGADFLFDVVEVGSAGAVTPEQTGSPTELPEGAEPPVAHRGNAPPAYPVSARRMGLTGSVILRIVVTADGEVGDLVVVHGEEPFARAAEDAVKRWRYEPARYKGLPIAVYRTVKVGFRLE